MKIVAIALIIPSTPAISSNPMVPPNVMSDLDVGVVPNLFEEIPGSTCSINACKGTDGYDDCGFSSLKHNLFHKFSFEPANQSQAL